MNRENKFIHFNKLCPFPGSHEEITRKVNKLEKEQKDAQRFGIGDYDSQFLKRMLNNAKFTAICIYTNNINDVDVTACQCLYFL